MKRILLFLLLYTSLFCQVNKDRRAFDRPIEKESIDYKDRLASSSVTLTPSQFFEANEAIQTLKILKMWDNTKALKCADWGVKKDGSNYVSTFYNVAYKEGANLIPSASSTFDTDGTSYWEAQSYHTNTYTENALRVTINNGTNFGLFTLHSNALTVGKRYHIKFNAKSNISIQFSATWGRWGNAVVISNPTTTTTYQAYEFYFTQQLDGILQIGNSVTNRNVGEYIQIDNITVFEILNPDLEQSTGSAQPLWVANVTNGRSVIRFDGTSDYLKTALTTWAQPLTVMMAVRQKSWAEYSTLFDGYTSTSMALHQRTTSPTIRMSTGGTILDNSNLTLNSMSLVTAVYNAGSSSIQVNNTTKVSGSLGSAVTPLGFTVGALPNGGSPSNIEVGLILIYQGTLTPEQEAGWKAYVNGKYRLY